MVKQVVKFEASDGKKFDTELEANGHELALQNTPMIDAFVDAIKAQKASAGYLRNTLPQFLAFQASYVPPAATEAPVDETAEA